MRLYRANMNLSGFFYNSKLEKKHKQIVKGVLTNLTDYFSNTTASVFAPNWVSAFEMDVTNCGGPQT